MDSVVGTLANFDNAVVTVSSPPNEIFHALDAHPVTAEAVASFASGAQAERRLYLRSRGTRHSRRFAPTIASSWAWRPRACWASRMLASCSVACDANNLTFKALGRFWSVPRVRGCPLRRLARLGALRGRRAARAGPRHGGRVLAKLDEGRLRARSAACSERTIHELAATLPTRRGNTTGKHHDHRHDGDARPPPLAGTPRCEALAREMQHDFLASPVRGREPGMGARLALLPGISGRAREHQPDVRVVASDATVRARYHPGDAWFDASSPYEFMAERLVRSCFNSPATRRARAHRASRARQARMPWCSSATGAASRRRAARANSSAGSSKGRLARAGTRWRRLRPRQLHGGQMSTRFSAFLEMVEKRKEAETWRLNSRNITNSSTRASTPIRRSLRDLEPHHASPRRTLPLCVRRRAGSSQPLRLRQGPHRAHDGGRRARGSACDLLRCGAPRL